MDQQIFILTKLHIPQNSTNIINRSKINSKLKLITEKKLSIISAPAGYGKSTTVSNWIRHSQQKNTQHPNKNNLNRLLSFHLHPCNPCAFVSHSITLR